MDCSPGSPLSAGSPPETAHTSDNPTWVNPADEGTSKQTVHTDLSLVRLFRSGSQGITVIRFLSAFPPDKAQPFPEPKSEPEPEPEAVTVAESHPEPKAPAAVELKKTAAPPTLPVVEEVPFRPSISLDTILNQEVHSLTSDIKNIMQTHHICYSSQLPPRLPPRHCWLPNSCFSDFVVPYVSPVPIQGHVKALCDKMDKLIPAPPAPSKVTSPPPPVTTSNLTTPPPTPIQTSKTKAEPSLSKSTTSSQSGKMVPVKETASTKGKTEASLAELGGEIYSPSQVTPDSPELHSQNPGAASGSGSGLLAGSLIGQLKPEVFSSLVEIFKDVTKNTVKFYIYSGDEGEESTVCKEIKVQCKVPMWS